MIRKMKIYGIKAQAFLDQKFGDPNYRHIMVNAFAFVSQSYKIVIIQLTVFQLE